jgi:hypothetical protein
MSYTIDFAYERRQAASYVDLMIWFMVVSRFRLSDDISIRPLIRMCQV